MGQKKGREKHFRQDEEYNQRPWSRRELDTHEELERLRRWEQSLES